MNIHKPSVIQPSLLLHVGYNVHFIKEPTSCCIFKSKRKQNFRVCEGKDKPFSVRNIQEAVNRISINYSIFWKSELSDFPSYGHLAKVYQGWVIWSFVELKPGAHLSYQLSWSSLVTVGVSCFLKCAVSCSAIFVTRAIGVGYSTCWIISCTSEHFLTVCARSELSAQ